MLNAFNIQSRKRTAMEITTTLLKRVKRFVVAGHPAEKPAGDGQSPFNGLPDEIALHVIHTVRHPDILGLRVANRRFDNLVSHDYYLNLLNGPAIQADLQRRIHSIEDQQRLFDSQQDEIDIFLSDAVAIARKHQSATVLNANILDYRSAVPAICDAYLSEAWANKGKTLLNAIPAFLQDNALGNGLLVLSGERTLSLIYWKSQYKQLYHALLQKLDKLRSVPNSVSPFALLTRHNLLNSINEHIIRLRIAKEFSLIIMPNALHLMNFSFLKLTRFPSALLNDRSLEVYWKDCKHLVLTGNYLTQLPNNLVKLSHLQSIHLSDNEFTEIPSVLLELPLTYLYLVNNYITKVPINIPESRLRDNDGVFISKVGLLVQQGVSEDTLSNKPVP